jgi:hypothetical protein
MSIGSLLLTVTLAAQSGGAAATKGDAKVADGTADQAMRTYLTALVEADEPTIRAVTLKADGLEWLWKGSPPPADQAKALRKDVAEMKIRVLKPGETFAMPGNRVVTIKPEEATGDRAMLVPGGAPVPTRLRKIDGHWKVDPAPAIASRKAADAVRTRPRTKPATKAAPKAKAAAKKDGKP